MSDDNQNAEVLIKEVLALVDERNQVEKELAASIESGEKIRLSVRRDEIVNKLKELSPKVQALSSTISSSVAVSAVVGNVIGILIGDDNAVVNQVFTKKDSHSLRTWWHSILREFGKYPCYAIFLLLPSDKEAINYFSEFGKELDLLSGKDCLVIAFGKTEFKGPKFDETNWSTFVDEHVSEGISITLAKVFNVEYTQFPCLILFKDIRQPEHVVFSLKDCTTENIAQDMRQVFSIINKAVSKEQDPIHALSLFRKTENFQKTGLSIVNGIQSFAGKTLDTAMEAYIKASIK